MEAQYTEDSMYPGVEPATHPGEEEKTFISFRYFYNKLYLDILFGL